MNGNRDKCADALIDLLDTAASVRDRSLARGWHGSAGTVQHLISALDEVRVRLESEGDPYLEVAWAFVDAGRLSLARHIVTLDRRR